MTSHCTRDKTAGGIIALKKKRKSTFIVVKYATFPKCTKSCVSGTDLRTSLAGWGLFSPYLFEKGVLGIFFLRNKVIKNESIFSAEVLILFFILN